MSARQLESWEVDDWLTSLGIDVENDVAMARSVMTWELFVKPVQCEDDDQYLGALEESWRERFGPFHPVLFDVYVSPNRGMVVNTGWYASKIENLPLSMQLRVDRQLAEDARRAAAKLAALVATPPRLLHTKGPRNKWGGAKGARTP